MKVPSNLSKMNTSKVENGSNITVPAYYIGASLSITVLNWTVIILPSIIFNASIIRLFVKNKNLRTPINLLIVNFSVAAIISSVLNNLIDTITLLVSYWTSTCVPYRIVVGTRALFSMGMLSITLPAIAVAQCVTLKWGPRIVTTYKVSVVIVLLWIYCILGATVLYAALEADKTILWSCSLFGEEASHIQRQANIFLLHMFLFDIVPFVIVIVFTISSLILYCKNSYYRQQNEELKRRMISLPILMSLLLFILDLCHRGFNALSATFFPPSTTTAAAGFRLIFISVVHFFEISTIIFPLFFLYINLPMRSAYHKAVQSYLGHCGLCDYKQRPSNKIYPSTSTVESEIL